MKYIPALDGVRGIAILLVLLMHFHLLGMGWMGVDLFFVLSGFLITNILLKGKNRSAGYYFKRFYWRRSLRIFPLYFSVLLLMTGAWVLTTRPEGMGEMLPYLYTYTYNIWLGMAEVTENTLANYLWSLSFEEQFYLVWPLLVFLISRRGLTWITVVLILISPGIRWLMGEYLAAQSGTYDHIGGHIYCLPIGRLDTFSIGALLALVPVNEVVRHPERVFYGCVGLFLAAGLVNMVTIPQAESLFDYSALGYQVASVQNYQHVWSNTLINLAAADLVLVASQPPGGKGGKLQKMLEARWLIGVGRISYGVYLLHWPLQYMMEKVIPLPESYVVRFLLFLPFLAFVLFISWLSFRYFESIFLRLKSRKFNYPPKEGDNPNG